MPVQEPRPDERPGQESEQRPRPNPPASPPRRQSGQEKRGEGEDARAEQSFRQKRDARAGPQDDATKIAQPVKTDGDAGHERVVGDELMRMLEITQARREKERSGDATIGGEVGEPERQPDVERARQPRGVVCGQDAVEAHGEERGGPEK